MIRSFLFSLIVSPLLFAQSSLTWAHKESDLPVDKNAHFGELENGMRYVIYKNAEPPGRISMRLHIDAGSLREADDQRGMAHFLEHMLFEGSKNYTSAELIPEMQRLGIAFGAHANAYTSFDETVYMLDLPNLQEKTLKLGFTVMRDFCDGALLQENEVEAERGVILSEKNTRDSVDFRLMKQQFRYLIPEHLVATRFPIGIEMTIKECPQPRIKDFYDTFYDPRLTTFVVVGDINVEEFEQKIKDTFSSFTPKEEKITTSSYGTITEPSSLQTALFTDPEVDEEDVSIIRCYKHTSVPDTTEQREKMLPLDIANAIVSRRLEKIAKEEGSPINTGASYQNTWFDEVSFGSLSVTPSDGKWKESVAILEQEFRRALLYGFTKSEYKEITSKLLKNAQVEVEAAGSRQSASIAMQIIPSINDRKVFTHPSTDLEALESILSDLSPEKCHEAFKAFWDIPGYHLILTTVEDSGNDAEVLKELYLKSSETALQAPEEKEALIFGYENFGGEAAIASENHVEDLDIHQLTLDNGVKINLKKTDFEKGKVHIQTRIGGGLASSNRKGLASFMQAIFTPGGLGKHSADDLRQIFSGNAITTEFVIDEDAFVFNGLTNQEDLSLQLKLLCAYLTDPAYREEAVRLYKKSLPDSYEQLAQTLEGSFQYLNAYAHGEDVRFAIPTEEEAAAFNANKGITWWLTSALKDSPLEISIIGDIDLEKTKEALLNSFGTLPSSLGRLASAQTPMPLKNLPETGTEKTFTYKSELDRAAAVTSWRTGGMTDNIAEARRLNILASILTNRMREEIREKLGSSYSPTARVKMSETFENYGDLTAYSLCKPEDIEKINALLIQLGEALATEGATEDELERAKNPVLEQIDASLRQNSYWLLTVMNRSQSEPKRLDWARSRSKDYADISLDDINALAQKYLKKENAIIYSLKPE